MQKPEPTTSPLGGPKRSIDHKDESPAAKCRKVECRHRPHINPMDRQMLAQLYRSQLALLKSNSRDIQSKMAMFEPPPKPTNPIGLHRILSPTASVKVSPICLGGISIGSSWSSAFGKNDEPFDLLDAYYQMGGNFIDTSNTYCSEDSERLIGDWMHQRGIRDQMVIATKYSAGYKAYDRTNIPLQSNYTGNSAKSMHVSVRDSLHKLKTDYIDILYVHWWGFDSSVEEVMMHLHALVKARQVLYLGVSDTPAWIVVKANAYARQHGLTPFSVYQGKWNVAFRDMEAEIIPMCQDQGMAIVPWAALGGGALLTSAEKKEAQDRGRNRSLEWLSERSAQISKVVEQIAAENWTTSQAVLLAYLFQQSKFVFPIVGVQTVAHVKAMPEALKIRLSEPELKRLRDASPFDPLFPMSFLFQEQPYDVRRISAANNHQYQMAAWLSDPVEAVASLDQGFEHIKKELSLDDRKS
ncbi:Norsolorinic acid reductase A [Pseudocercospora fuligena]|uniref:Norsolorinic acid reductase A n=1 Tax=Pseudocercospora fuligena TaxID=685502 RepID=A0A8H6VDI0_9PEZI|nr:Norsolorinic acid reductase A [Pseudocercospora fuligena]